MWQKFFRSSNPVAHEKAAAAVKIFARITLNLGDKQRFGCDGVFGPEPEALVQLLGHRAHRTRIASQQLAFREWGVGWGGGGGLSSVNYRSGRSSPLLPLGSGPQ